MNLFFKKKQNPITLHDPLLGDMTYIYRWWINSPFAFKLWKRNYSMEIGINVTSKDNPITDIQHEVFSKLCMNITDIQKRTEEVLERKFPFLKKCDPSKVFKNGSIIISTDGKCAISIDVDEEYENKINFEDIGAFSNNSFGISIIPEVYIINSVDEYEAFFG